MANTNTIKFISIALIVAIILGITVFSIANYQKLEASLTGFFVSFFCLMIYFFYYRCSKCGNLFALKVNNTKLIDTHQSQSYYTQEENVGVSVRRNRYGDVIGQTDHYMDVNYVTKTTVNTYERTLVCKYCGAVTKYQFDNEKKDTHRRC